jgi:S-adenosylmethionine hydrolase
MPERPRPIITLTTDFGTTDHYVSAVKGAILSVTTDAILVDITHDIPPHDVMTAAWVLARAIPSFPRRTIHVAVTDPTVGTARKPILIVTDDHLLIGPDNGIFSFVLEASPPSRIVALTAPHYLKEPVSATFHARDIFGPVAAHLSRGVEPVNFGEPLEACVRLELPRPTLTPQRTVRASVIHVDRFGNLILNVTRQGLEALMGADRARALAVVAGAARIETMVATYAEAAAGAPALLYNSSGFLEIAAHRARASEALGLGAGAVVDVVPRA